MLRGELGGDAAKLAYGVLRYSPNPVVCAIDSRHAGQRVSDVVSLPRDCPVVDSVAGAARLGAEALVLGIAPPGGQMPDAWRPALDEAIRLGMSLVNGMHEPLAPRYPRLRDGQVVWDVRQEPPGLLPGKGLAMELKNRRVLLIGTDMAVGKMTAGLEMHAAAKRQGFDSRFIATGQVGMVITGGGVALDAVRVDFASGAIEREVMAAQDAEIVIVEGQGSLVHPGSTATLPLLRGSMPTHVVLCHRARQGSLRRLPHIPIPPLKPLVELYLRLAEVVGTFPRPRMAAVALNTSGLDDVEAREAIREIATTYGWPCFDPVREGGTGLLQAVLDE